MHTSHKGINKQVVKRHNGGEAPQRAVLMVHRAVARGSLPVVFATCDACPADCLPDGVLTTRPPAWVVPSPPPARAGYAGPGWATGGGPAGCAGSGPAACGGRAGCAPGRACTLVAP